MSRVHALALFALALGPFQAEETPFPETFRAFRDLIDQGDVEAARAFSEPLFADTTLDERRRAALHFGLGLVGARADDESLWPDASGEFQSARALAGAGELRLDASYDAGVVELQTAERLRARIPEVAQAQGTSAAAPLQQVPPPGQPLPIVPPAGPGGAAAPAPGAPPEQEDPLPLARAAYERARGTLCERLRADWQDVDTRANLELVQRRLHELDLIEQQRQEQEKQDQEQQGQSGDQEKQDQQDSKDDPKEQEKAQQDPSQQDESKEDQSSQQEQQRDPQKGEQEQQQQGEPQDPTAEQPSQEKPQELQPPAGEEQQGEPAPQAQDSERHLTREEVMRLLDRLAEMEQQGKEFEARLRQARREAVERDW